jgi:hypothetical protein
LPEIDLICGFSKQGVRDDLVVILPEEGLIFA